MARSRRGVGAAAMVAVCLLVGACTPSSGETPSPTPLPSTSPTPTENSVERQERLDYAAAEKSYRDFRTEFQRIAGAGGTVNPTPAMSKAAGGPYLAANVDVLRAFKELGSHQSGTEKIVNVNPLGHSDEKLQLEVCEDTRTIKVYDQKGELIGSGELRLSDLEVRRSSGSWKVWSATGRKVTSCEP